MHGDRVHPTVESVRGQLLRVAPEWRKVFGPELETEIAEVEADADA